MLHQATRLHMLDFLNTIDHHSRPIADIEEGHISTASCILESVDEDRKTYALWSKGRIVTGEMLKQQLY